MKSRGCYETPGGTILMAAARELESLTLDRYTTHYKQQIELDYAEMVYNGLWFTPLREALDAFFETVAQPVTGEITMRLFKGNLEPVSRKSPNSLYSLNIASFTMGAEYDQKDALGFINSDRPADQSPRLVETINCGACFSVPAGSSLPASCKLKLRLQHPLPSPSFVSWKYASRSCVRKEECRAGTPGRASLRGVADSIGTSAERRWQAPRRCSGFADRPAAAEGTGERS